MDLVNARFNVCLINLEPTVGHEINKTRPCLVISPDEMNRRLKTVIIAPMTTTERNYPIRVNVTFQGKKGQIALDQLRVVDTRRLTKNLGAIEKRVQTRVLRVLQEMFED